MTKVSELILCRRTEDTENTPISVNVVLENVKRKGEDSLLQIRTNPPSPQCFSATRGAPGKTTPSKLSKSKLMVCNFKLALVLTSYLRFKLISSKQVKRYNVGLIVLFSLLWTFRRAESFKSRISR